MMLKLRQYTTLLIASLAIACSNKGDEQNKPLARVFDKYLYAHDLSGLVKPGTSPSDSLAMVLGYIQDWVKQELMLSKAEDNVVVDKETMDRKLEDYRASLLVYEYENLLTKDKLDTAVTQQQLQEYYNAHADNFDLQNDIIRLRYAKIKLSENRLEQMRRAWADGGFPDDRLEDMCKVSATKYSLNDTVWLPLDQIGSIIPKGIQGGILGATGTFERRDSSYLYLIKIKEYKTVGSTAPLSFEKENIYQILVNKRKVELIKKIKEEIFKHALEHKDFEVYNNKKKTGKAK